MKMTREEAINELEMAFTRLNINGHMDNNRKTAFEMAIEALKQLKWIKVKDRLPDFNIPVLAYAVGKIDGYFGDSKTVITEYSDRKYGFNIVGWNEPWQYFLTNYKITHWMPLPEPPRVHAQWICKKSMMYCSQCACGFDRAYRLDYNYCPNCGAIMDNKV